MRNIKLLIEYDGTSYSGWQRQENGRSVQGDIEEILSRILQEEINLVGAGRTDAGVHARGQVANFRSNSLLGLNEIHHGLNSLLPDDIVIHDAAEVPFDFHARYSATGREYTYTIAKRQKAIARDYSWHLQYTLDVESLQEAARIILQVNDFESFCKTKADVNHHKCRLTKSQWEIDDDEFRYRVAADRFLHGMVRALVGTMVDIGRGYLQIADLAAIIGKKNRSEAGAAAPARGLVLEKVYYENK